jgi:hypothetical protein
MLDVNKRRNEKNCDGRNTFPLSGHRIQNNDHKHDDIREELVITDVSTLIKDYKKMWL